MSMSFSTLADLGKFVIHSDINRKPVMYRSGCVAALFPGVFFRNGYLGRDFCYYRSQTVATTGLHLTRHSYARTVLGWNSQSPATNCPQMGPVLVLSSLALPIEAGIWLSGAAMMAFRWFSTFLLRPPSFTKVSLIEGLARSNPSLEIPHRVRIYMHPDWSGSEIFPLPRIC
jgi:hypothetical protein